MSLNTRIEQFLATVHSADNMASARDKLAEATDLLRQLHAVQAGPASAPKITANRRRKA